MSHQPPSVLAALPKIQCPSLDFNLPKIKGFKIAALSITSLLRHIDELHVQMFNKTLDILIVNETRLDDTCQSEFHIDDYSVITKNRNRQGDGVAIYRRDPTDFINRKDLQNENLEFLCVEIRRPKTKPFLVSTWYRPPNSPINLFVDFKAILEKIESLNIESYILGDFNCNVATASPDGYTTKLLDFCDLSQYSQLIYERIRVTRTTSTLIDLFLTNEPSKFNTSGVSHTGLSDHSLIYGASKLVTPSVKPKVIKFRSYKRFDLAQNLTDISQAPWDQTESYNDPTQAWQLWKNMFLEIANWHTPTKSKCVQNSSTQWLISE